MAPSEQDMSYDRTPDTRRTQRWRMVLFLSVPVLLLIGGIYMWLTGGRYISTENAYVKRDKVSVSADVSGKVVEVDVHENQHVLAGQVLFRIDDAPFRIALAEAEAELANQRLKVEQLRADYREQQADVVNARQDVAYQKTEFDRRRKLRDSGYAAQADYDKALHILNNAKQTLVTEQQSMQSALAALGGNPDIPVEQHPQVLAAKAKRDKAKLDLDRTAVKAPIAGIVSQSDSLAPGRYMIQGAPAFSLVQGKSSWIDANFKETDLTHMAVGQTADISFDAYPKRTFKAHVQSIGAATGSEFSLLPPQNATGNWVKVVQRVTVRLRLNNPDEEKFLQAGLSAKVTVDTGYSHFAGKPVATAAQQQD